MSLGRCAYRQGAIPSPTTFTDYLWVSDELLASTFRRFVSGQRRYESRVPGPLEARRRLAKRRNTALASLAGSGPGDDIASLLGKNGREHMKWREPERGFDIQFSSPTPPAPPLSLFDHFLSPDAFGGNSEDAGEFSTEFTREEFFGEKLQEYQTVSAIKSAIRELSIDLRQEPSSSRLLFDHFLGLSQRKRAAADELALFLDDPHLNVPGAGNYLRLAEHSMSRMVPFQSRPAQFHLIIRALELGVVPPEEIGAIIVRWSDWRKSCSASQKAKRKLLKIYRAMWDAIGKCAVYGHRDMDQSLVQTWLGVCLEEGTVGYLRLATSILLATEYEMSLSSSWLPKFVARLLRGSNYSLPAPDRDIIIESLKPFDIDTISNSLICGTEILISSQNTRLLRRWGKCLAELHDASRITLSKAWVHIREQPDSLAKRQLILQRLWMLHTMRRFSQRRASQVTKSVTKRLYRLYESSRRVPRRNGQIKIDLWTSLVQHISRLKIPFNLEAMADDLRTGKPMTNTMRKRLRQFQNEPLSFSELFANTQTYNASRHLFFNNFDNQIRQVDVASPDFRLWAIHIARTGNSPAIWSVLRLLRAHIPLKIALSRAWPLPDPADGVIVRYNARPRSAGTPDPHDALDMVHSLAASFACAKQLSPQRAYRLVRWLYLFLLRHGAPIQTPIARALYHAGVVRFRQEKGYISPIQYDYIWGIVEQTEGREYVRALRSRTLYE